MSAKNPRLQRDEIKSFLGKKVMIGTSSYHYVSGRVEAVTEDDRLRVRISGGIALIPLDEIATIQEAPESQAEYFK